MIASAVHRGAAGGAALAVNTWRSNSEALLASIIVVGEWTGLARGLMGRPYLAGLLDLALICLLVASIRGRSPHARWHAVDILVGIFVVLAMAQMFNPNVPDSVTALEGFRKTAFAASGYAVVRLRGMSPVRLAAYVALGSIPALLFGIRQFFAPMPFDLQIVSSSGVAETTFMQASQLRAFSPTSGPFHLGILAASSVLIGVVFGLGRRVEWLIVAVIGLVALVLTITRANWIATALGTAVAVALLLMTSRVSRRHVVVVCAAILVGTGVLTAAAAIVGGDTWSRWQFYIGSVLNPLGARNVQFRFEYWREMVDAIRANPIIGYGTSSAADGFRDVYEAAGRAYFQPHSIYFKPALEQGILGLVLMIGILGSTIVGSLRSRRDAPVAAALVGGLVIIVAVSGLTGPMLDAYPFNLFFWSMAGGLVAEHSRRGASWTP